MSEKIKMQLGRLDNENPVKAGNVETDRTKEFLKAQIAEETPSTTRKGNSLKVTEQGKMVEVARKDALDAYPPEKVIEQEIPFPKEEVPVSIKKKKVGILKSIGRFFNRNKERTLALSALLTLGEVAGANNNAERESNTKFTDHINTNLGGGERKVKEVPPGYVKSHVDGKKTYYKKVIGGISGELKPAKPGDGKGGAEYEKWLINTLKSGKYSPEELVKKGYISDAEKYHKYYTPPAVDIVYTEPEEIKEKEADPYSAYAKDGESIWGTNRHLIAILSVPVRDTKSITESGNINTSNSEHMVLVRFVDKMGKPTGECVELKTGEIQDYFGTTMTMQSDELMKELKAKIEKNPTYVATAEDFAKNK